METKAIEIILNGMAVGLGFLVALIFNKAAKEMERLTDSVNELNVKVAKIIESINITEKQILEHSARIERLESKTMGVQNGRIKKSRSGSHKGSARARGSLS